MADFNLKDDLLGFGRSQLKYMLFHNTTLAGLTDYTHKRGLFFFDGANDSLEVLADNTDKWRTFLQIRSLNDSLYDDSENLDTRLLIGTGEYGNVIGYNPGTVGFIKMIVDGYPSIQSKILFEDIEPTDYTTVITAPGVDTRFATEKAIVDYVASATFSAEDNILDWDGTKYLPFAAKKGVDPGYAYFYTSSEYAGTQGINRLHLSGTFRAAGIEALSSSNTGVILYTSGEIELKDAGNIFTLGTSGNSATIDSKNGATYYPIYIGKYGIEDIIINPATGLFNIDMTTVRLNKGTALKYLYLDASKNITYVDAPVGGVTPVDNILDWDTDAYKPYTVKTASAFYTGLTAPDAVATVLNYDGIFRATQLFEGNTRVMTTHGNWAANGSLHAVTTTTNAGFCPQLPVVLTSTTFLRGDGSWASPNLQWTESVGNPGILSPVNNNYIYVNITGFVGDGYEGAVNGITDNRSGIYGESINHRGVVGVSVDSYGGYFSSINGGAAKLIIAPSVLAIDDILVLERSDGGAVGSGLSILFRDGTDVVTIEDYGKFSLEVMGIGILQTSDFLWSLRNAGSAVTEVMRLKGNGELITINQKITGLATYADNTAALAGGLTAGQVYKTSTGEVRITY